MNALTRRDGHRGDKSGKQSVRQRPIAGLEEVNAHAVRGNGSAALAVLADLRRLVNDGDPNGAARLRAVLDVYEERVAAMSAGADGLQPPAPGHGTIQAAA